MMVKGSATTALPLCSCMKTIEHFDMRFTVFAFNFGLMQCNTTFVPADSAEEEKAVNPCILLDNKLFISTIVEGVSKEPPNSVTLQLIRLSNGFMCSLREEDVSFLPVDR